MDASVEAPIPVRNLDRPAVRAARDAERALWLHFGLDMTERDIEVREPRRRVRVLECGNPRGLPLVFVQGGLGEALLWTSLLARLREFRCLTLDRPGGGFSEGVDFMAVDVRALAVDVLAGVLDAAGVDRAPFIANSMGAWWTLQLALRRPDRVTGMVMLGCPAVILNTSAPLPMRLIGVPGLGRLLARAMVPANARKARNRPTVLGHPSQVGRDWSEVEAEAVYRFAILPDAPRSWRTLLGRFLRLAGSSPEMRITEDELRRISQPTVFGWGCNDPFGSVETGRHAAGLMASARLEIVGCGHLPWLDDPDGCARLVRAHVAATSR